MVLEVFFLKSCKWIFTICLQMQKKTQTILYTNKIKYLWILPSFIYSLCNFRANWQFHKYLSQTNYYYEHQLNVISNYLTKDTNYLREHCHVLKIRFKTISQQFINQQIFDFILKRHRSFTENWNEPVDSFDLFQFHCIIRLIDKVWIRKLDNIVNT